jgi:REP element-mobilizing transposase RayT
MGGPRRRALRLRDHDYATPGIYFVTVCTKGRALLFGEVVDGAMVCGAVGDAVRSAWDALPSVHCGLLVDAFVVMPNHVHGVIVLTGEGESGQDGAARCRPPLLGAVVRGFKARATLAARRLPESPVGIGAGGSGAGAIWQRGFYEHVVRNEHALDRVRRYIAENPARWALDRENPVAAARDMREEWEA